MVTRFSTLLNSARFDGPRLTAEISEDWMQGRSVFGGLQLALALQSIRELVPARALRAVQVMFAMPVKNIITVEPHVIRVGKNATQAEARILDGDSTAALVVALYGDSRSSVVHVTPPLPQTPPDSGLVFPTLPGITPNFLQHFEIELLVGHPPYGGVGCTKSVYRIGMLDDGPTNIYHIAAVADVVPPLALSYLEGPAPGSSLTWMLEFLTDELDAFDLRDWQLHVEMHAAQNGYVNQSTMVWGPGGIPVARSHQCMAVFG